MTSMATAGSRWGVVMSRNAGFSDQVEFCLGFQLLWLILFLFICVIVKLVLSVESYISSHILYSNSLFLDLCATISL